MKPGMAVSTLKSASGQFLGLVFGAVAVKCLAVIAGPAGVGLYSVLRQLQQILSSVASIGGPNAVVQGLSSHEGRARERFFLSTLYLFIGMSVFMSGVVLAGADFIASWTLAGDHASAIRWLVIPIVSGALLFFLRGVLTSDMQYGSIALINLLMGLGAAVVALPVGLAFMNGYPDLLVILVGGGIVPATIVAFIHVRRLGYLDSLGSLVPRGAGWVAAKRFLRVAIPSLFALLLTLGCVLIVRARAVHLYGLEGAGQFDAAWSISAMYLALFLTSLQSYLLPELSQTANGTHLRRALSKAFHFALMLSLPLVVGLVVFKPLVMNLLFSKVFTPALDILRWVLLGDFVRVLGWIMSTTLMARADMKGYTLAGGLWSLVFVSVAWVLLPKGIEWVGVAYLVSYTAYLVFLSWRLWRAHGVGLELRRIGQWLLGLVLVTVTSWLCWHERGLFAWSILMLIPAMLFSWVIMKSDERQFALSLAQKSMERVKQYASRR